MTSPRTYGGGYYTAPTFPDTPIYDSLVAERGTPQIAPIRVPSYDTGSRLPALQSALPALPAAPSYQQPQYNYGQQPSQQHYPQAGYQQQHTPPQGYRAPVDRVPQASAPVPFIPQQATEPRYGQQPQQMRPPAGAGYEAMRPVAPRPAPAPYVDQYGRTNPAQQGGWR